MDAIKNVNDFKHFLKMNQEKIFSNVEKAKDISVDDDWMLEDEWDNLYEQGVNKEMNQYKIGEVWWTQFPFEEIDKMKRRPAIVIDDNKIAILAMMVTTKEKNNPYSVEIDDWKEAGLPRKSWARIDRIIQMDEWRMEKKIGDLSEHDLIKLLQLIKEKINGDFHEFSLVAINNPDGKYLQIYDENWKCWLFPYYKTVSSNKDNVDKCISELLGMNCDTDYVTNAVHCKYSEKDEVYKIYKHNLYKLSLDSVSGDMNNDSFELNGKKCCWKSMEELESDNEILEKNDDIIAFVKMKCKLN